MTRRLRKEIENAARHKGLPMVPFTSDLNLCYSALIGPPDTPYEDGLYIVSSHFPTEYPMVPPQVLFLTPICHPNINAEGVISLNILQSDWTPALTFVVVVRSLEALLSDPNFDEPIVPELAEMYRTDKQLYWRKAEEMKRQYAS